jgi:chaperonin cofactor prefoldin
MSEQTVINELVTDNLEILSNMIDLLKKDNEAIIRRLDELKEGPRYEG